MNNKLIVSLFAAYSLLAGVQQGYSQQIFDVHLHGDSDRQLQVSTLARYKVYRAAISTSWDLQEKYSDSSIAFLRGLMFPCPNGKVPYSLQSCFANDSEWPDLGWVETKLKEKQIDFLGEILNQYYGIKASDSLLMPYYELANRYQIPVGIHTGGAGPNHGAPNFKMELGNPQDIKPILDKFPGIKIWVMHAGDQFYKETIKLMKEYPSLYTDISVISNPYIVDAARFSQILKEFLDAGLEDRLMFGTDNGPIEKIIERIESDTNLSAAQKKKIYFANAERFFSRG